MTSVGGDRLIITGRLVALACALTVGLLAAPVAAAASAPFGHDCTAQNGVRFCPAATLAQRVRSFDGIPLDVDVTLPRRARAPTRRS